MILEARAAAELILETAPSESLSEAEVVAARDVLRAMLLVPGLTVASFSAFGHMGGVQEVVANATVTDEGLSFLQSKLNTWLSKRGEGGGFLRPTVQHPSGSTGPAITPAQMQKVFTAPVAAGTLRGIYLTVAFSANPERASHEMLAAFHAQLQLAIEHSISRGGTLSARWRVAEKLLEPDFSHYPELRRHSDAVVARVEAFARYIALTPSEVDAARLAALVHDCGMRLLDYDRLYRKRDISPDELGILQEHVQIGAAIVEPSSVPRSRAPSFAITSGSTAAATRTAFKANRSPDLQDHPDLRRLRDDDCRRQLSASPDAGEGALDSHPRRRHPVRRRAGPPVRGHDPPHAVSATSVRTARLKGYVDHRPSPLRRPRHPVARRCRQASSRRSAGRRSPRG
jgi:hypothetical protein